MGQRDNDTRVLSRYVTGVLSVVVKIKSLMNVHSKFPMGVVSWQYLNREFPKHQQELPQLMKQDDLLHYEPILQL